MTCEPPWDSAACSPRIHPKADLVSPCAQEDWEQTVNASESTWMMGARPARVVTRGARSSASRARARAAEDGELHLVLTKGSKGVTWRSLIRGHTAVDEYTASEVQKSLMLERFQAEVRSPPSAQGAPRPRRALVTGRRLVALSCGRVAESGHGLLRRDIQRSCAGPEDIHGRRRLQVTNSRPLWRSLGVGWRR